MRPITKERTATRESESPKIGLLRRRALTRSIKTTRRGSYDPMDLKYCDLLWVLVGSWYLAALIFVTADALFKTDLPFSALLLLVALVLLCFWYYYRSPSLEQIMIQKFLTSLVAATVYSAAIIHISNVERQNWHEALYFLLLGYIVMVPGFAAGYIVKGLDNENHNPAALSPKREEKGTF
jgi:hypothetical protein